MKARIWMAATVLTLALASAPAVAATSASISVTVSLQEVISVSLDTATWNIGPISLGDTATLPTVTITNDGNVPIDVVIAGTNGAGGWTLGTAGNNAFQVEVESPALTLTTATQPLATNLAVDGTKAIDLTYSAPTASSDAGGVDQSFSITVTASQAP